MSLAEQSHWFMTDELLAARKIDSAACDYLAVGVVLTESLIAELVNTRLEAAFHPPCMLIKAARARFPAGPGNTVAQSLKRRP